MDFELSEELKMIQSLARDFVERRLKPLERDLLGRSADLSDARVYLPPEKEAELIKAVKDMGLWGVGIPEELGGAGLSALSVCLVEEELARTIVPFRFGDVTPILFDCSPKQREEFLLPAINNEKQPYLALMEDGSGADPAAIAMRAEKSGGHYLLNGKKISFSRRSDDYFGLVFASAGKGASCFLVAKDTPGFTVGESVERTGWMTQLREPLILEFNDCRVPAGNLLGREGKAFHLGEKLLPQRRIVRGARCVGIAARLLEEASVRAGATATFGQPISNRASVQAALADTAADIHAARLMVYEAATLADAGKSVNREAALVKLFTTRLLRAAADRAAHIFNGPPYIEGVSMERLCRHALEATLADTTLEKQRSLIAKDALKGLRF